MRYLGRNDTVDRRPVSTDFWGITGAEVHAMILSPIPSIATPLHALRAKYLSDSASKEIL
ncbi:hypothetical protein MASR1M60_09650 [Rhodocyclaceae bacterium]